MGFETEQVLAVELLPEKLVALDSEASKSEALDRL
jgi:hypothetical protein